MLRKSRGSILIMSVLVFSIISIICVTCSALILSNNRIYNLEYYNELLKQENLGMIELVHSNFLKEVDNAVATTNTEDEFYKYFTQNNSQDFINKINDISGSNIKNGEVTVYYNATETNKEFIKYKITTKYKINNYDKYFKICLKIKNPWYEKAQDATESDDLDLETISDNPIIQENETYEVKSDIKIDESKLVIFYNYEEI